MKKFNTLFHEIDEALNYNNCEGKLIALASRPGMGKSTLLLDILLNTVSLNSSDVLLFTMEMSQLQVIKRLLAKESLSDEKLNRMHVDETSAPSIDYIEKKILEFDNLDMVFIDSIDLIKNYTNGAQEEIMHRLKSICKDRNISIIYTCQLNRLPEQRIDNQPILSDIDVFVRENADAIFVLYRPSYYCGDDPIAQLRSLKNMSGELWEVPLVFNAEKESFEDIVDYTVDYEHEKRVELSVHTKMSDDVSTIGVQDAIDFALKNKHKAIAFTNLNNVQDFPLIQKIAKKHSELKVIYGARVLYETDIGGPYAMTLLVKNQKGVKNLYEIISSMKNMCNSKITNINSIEQSRENLLCSACGDLSELFRAIENKKTSGEIISIAKKYDYFEIFPTNDIKTRLIYKKIVELANELNIPVVATGDCHYCKKSDEICRRVVKEFKGGCEDNNQQYLRNTKEMLSAFAYLGEGAHDVVVVNSNLIAEAIDRIDPLQIRFPELCINDAEKRFLKEIKVKVATLYGANISNIVSKRLEKEFNYIINYDFTSIYMLAHFVAKYARDNNRLIYSPGAVGSSFVAYLLGITNINPLPAHYRCSCCNHIEFSQSEGVYSCLDLPQKQCPYCGKKMLTDGHNIPFESFMGVDGNKVPRIDFIVEESFKDNILQYICDMFGKERVLQANCISPLTEYAANMYVKMYQETTNREFDYKLESYIKNQIIGTKRKETLHPGGLIIIPTDNDICDYTPFNVKDNDDIITQSSHFDFYDIRDTVFNFNILGSKRLENLSRIQKLTGVSLSDIDIMHSEILDVFKDMDTSGIPEFDSEFMRDLLSRIKPQKHSELIKIIGFALGVNTWNANGEHLIEKGISISNIPTLKEDVMNDLLCVGVERRDAFKMLESVRKGLIFKNKVSEEHKQFFKEISSPLGENFFGFCSKVGYMFPKAHAIEYVIIALYYAWFKKHYPKEFKTVCLRDVKNNKTN